MFHYYHDRQTLMALYINTSENMGGWGYMTQYTAILLLNFRFINDHACTGTTAGSETT